MDAIAFGAASKVLKREKDIRENTLGTGVEGSALNIKGRIDTLESGIGKINEKANRLIVNDAVNIMKAHAKFNAVTKTARYKMYNMIFEDFLDESGIDTIKSSGYSINATNGYVSGGVVISTQEVADAIPTKAILTVEEGTAALQGKYFISRDEGENWQEIVPDSLLYFRDDLTPPDTKIRLKAELPSGVQLLNYGLTWS